MVASAPPRIPGLTDWRPLARGGFATIWEARQQSLNRLVAVKIDERTLDAIAERRRFLRESGAAGRMSGHPGIVTVHDAGILGDDRPYLVMELCPGGSLSRWLKPEARATQHRVRQVGVQIADALSAAHGRGVLHRDVKPANILIDAFGNPGLADFGLAALPEPGDDLSETLEAITPAYAPPESFQQKPPTEFGDVFSLAATLYALLKGQPPRWTGDRPPSVQEALAGQSLAIERIPGVDPALMDVLLGALTDEPTDRPTAAEFRDQLAALKVPDVRPGETVPADPEEPSGRVGATAPGGQPSPPRRRRSLALVAALAVVLAIGTAVALLTPDAQVGVPAPAVTASGSATESPGPTGAPGPTQATGGGPTGAAVPEGYLDCSADLGPQTFCATAATDECWGGVFSAYDQPALGTPAACDENHVYQTFAAGRLSDLVRRQSQLEQDDRVQQVCTPELVNEMLSRADRRDDWEVLVLPPQLQADEDDDLYRCIFGRGERSASFRLEGPG